MIWPLLFLSSSFMIIIPLTDLSHDPLFCSFWSPFNFIPYAFIGILLSDFFDIQPPKSPKNTLLLISLSIVFLVFALGEWCLNFQDIYVSLLYPYMRVSVVIGTSIIFLSSFYLDNRLKILQSLSNYALGIYCLQLFFTNAYWSLFNGTPKGSILYTALIFFMCLVGTIYLQKTFSRKII